MCTENSTLDLRLAIAITRLSVGVNELKIIQLNNELACNGPFEKWCERKTFDISLTAFMIDQNPSFSMFVVVNVNAGEARGGEEREFRLHVTEKVAPLLPLQILLCFSIFQLHLKRQ